VPAQPVDAVETEVASIADATAALQPVDRRAVSVWRIEALGDAALALVFGVGASLVLRYFDVRLALVAIPLLLAILFAAVSVLILPERQWRSWRYAIGEREIELRHGIWWQTWVRIPMAKIQHVDTHRGPFDRRYGLANLVLYTAAGARHIPGLALEVAERTRDQIAVLANVRDDL
jgi:membrane protein YdbS with pleckstrin-like domain